MKWKAKNQSQPQPKQNANQTHNQNQGPTVGKISAKPRTQYTYVRVITQGGETMGDDGTLPNIRLVAQNKAQFNVDAEKKKSLT